MNNLALSVALATAPSSAFAELRERPRFWFPLLLAGPLHRGSHLLVLQRGGHRVVQGRDVRQQPRLQTLPEDKRAAAMGMVQPQHVAVGIGGRHCSSSCRSSCCWRRCICWLAAKVTKLPQGFKHWFALSLLDVTAHAAGYRRRGDHAAPERHRADQPRRVAAAVAQRAACSTCPWAAPGRRCSNR